eukprot:TRINITY_DN14056_c0_g1_i1.p1 TRINITY_DN14056_c0_g1~~TRINITY_DN14056_c0_g1_i1.p1  ORF type:complete len:435 (+),score=46.71 TRINITY_DN14056_c0_g1_i1:196-1305(+)
MATVVREQAPATGKRYLVIGTGSVGVYIIEQLVERGEKSVKGFDVAAPKRPLPCGVSFICGNVTDYAVVRDACKDVDVVFTTAALIRYYERLSWQYQESHAVNVIGTANIINACVENGVQVLVQTSSSNVCVGPGLVSMTMDESSPYVDAASSPNHYGWTKVQAEQAIIQANGTELPNGKGHLATAAVRPCSAIFGPNDNFITEKTLREGEVKVFVPDAKIDYIFVENVVWGHLLLEKKLHSSPAEVGGSAFCISNDDPIVADDFYVALMHFYEQSFKQRLKCTHLPRRLMTALAWASETYQFLTGRRIKGELALLTPATLNTAGLSYAFSSKKARDVLGYRPLYSFDEAIQKTVALWAQNVVSKPSLK